MLIPEHGKLQKGKERIENPEILGNNFYLIATLGNYFYKITKPEQGGFVEK
ncbi:hypothetical protein MTHERMMSTA1_20010 [Methanosarcina thermophila MST-A1]|uniref:Coenzyme PQQ synthesis protein E n=1 Tax=Methanosarcina thermophila TaxID=2210 RepID=A0A3G9CVG2_METTE|nr:coenzyme PQQ synthesis protein E [Methanosarcina thermophila]GLI14875.1 hypothetical protein MTHERMMSTA1_20010 [Methanosarcina thermophila MST-A1]